MHNVYIPVAGLKRMTTGSAVSAIPYRATQVNTSILEAIIEAIQLLCIYLFKRVYLMKLFAWVSIYIINNSNYLYLITLLR